MNLPTKITLIRLVLIPVFIALFLIEFPFHFFAATAVFIIASLSDFLDGYLARKLNQVTDLGKFLDPLADKALVCTALILVCTNQNAFSLTILIATIVIIVRELMITAFRTVAVSKNVVLAADIWGKIKTMTQMIGLSLYITYPSAMDVNLVFGNVLLYGGFVMLMISAIFALISAFNYIISNKTVLSSKDDDKVLAKNILSKLDGTLAIAESFTGGCITSELVKIPGASKKLIKGIVCYSNQSKIEDIGVDNQIISKHGAVSEQTAKAMVEGALKFSKADYAVATTGNAGPTAEREGEEGVCYISVADKEQTVVKQFAFKGNREIVINQGKKQALKMLDNFIKYKNLTE